jgi:hypothetical protein
MVDGILDRNLGLGSQMMDGILDRNLRWDLGWWMESWIGTSDGISDDGWDPG